MDLRSYIRDVADFPIPGILFRDITPLLADPAAFATSVDLLTDAATSTSPEVVVGIESRGFLFGAPIAHRLSLPFVPVRKAGKLPAARMTVEYSLEYGTSQLDIHADALWPGARAFVVDDLLATGGTARATAKLVELVGGNVSGFGFLVELCGLGGREALAGYGVYAAVSYA